MPLHSKIFTGVGDVGSKVGMFIRENPFQTGAALAASVVGITAITKIRKNVRAKKKAKRKTSRTRKKVQKRKARRRTSTHKARVSVGLDKIHKKGKKRGISLKTVRAAIASPRTPPHLKKGLRKLLRSKSRHTHRR